MTLSLAWLLLTPLVRALPLRVAYGAARLLMTLVYFAWPGGRRAIRANLAVVLDTTDQRRLDYWGARQLRRYGEYLVDAARLESLAAKDCFDALIFDQWEQADAVMRDGPLLYVSMHFGNWDVGGGAFAARGRRPYVLIQPLPRGRIDRAVRASRARLGMTLVDIDRGVLQAARALRDGGTVGVLFDRPLGPARPGDGGVDVRFFGAPCRVPAGMARLALATGARVVPLAIVRHGGDDFRFRALLDFDFTYLRTGDRASDVRALTQGVMDRYQRWVRRYPDQWYQFRPFFQARRGEARAASAGSVARAR